MRLRGMVDQQEVLILVDSGSVGMFVSARLASLLHHPTEMCESTQLVVADGSPVICDEVFKILQWASQGHVFSLNAGVLLFQCYDMILGQDWLAECSPLWVHWRKR